MIATNMVLYILHFHILEPYAQWVIRTIPTAETSPCVHLNAYIKTPTEIKLPSSFNEHPFYLTVITVLL
jgi:hypothetical protein